MLKEMLCNAEMRVWMFFRYSHSTRGITKIKLTFILSRILVSFEGMSKGEFGRV